MNTNLRKIYIAILAATLLIIAFTAYFLFAGGRNDNNVNISVDQLPQEQVACTMEALICPDGSSVGRSGPMCEFAACANRESFSGRLTQEGGEFFLAIPAPAGTGMTSYSLPLKFSRVSNVLGTLVGKNVKVKGAFVSGNTLEVTTIDEISSASSAPTPAPAPFTTGGEIGVGQTRNVNGVRITVNKIVEDSRCPVDVQCIHAGKLVANVTLRTDTDTRTLDMTMSELSYPFDSYDVSLVSATPEPRSGSAISASSYRLTFKVEKISRPAIESN